MGVGILCQLLQVWDQVAVGMITLTEWLLGDNQAELGNEKTLDLVRTQVVFPIINLNLNTFVVCCLGEHLGNCSLHHANTDIHLFTQS